MLLFCSATLEGCRKEHDAVKQSCKEVIQDARCRGDRLHLMKGGYIKACQFSLENKNNFSRDFERSYKSNHLAFRVTFIEKLFLCHLPVRKRTFKASGQQELIYSDAYVLLSGVSWGF